MLKNQRLQEFVNLVNGAPRFIIRELPLEASTRVLSPTVVPDDWGLCWMAAEVTLANKRKVEAVLVLESKGGIPEVVYWRVDDEWFEWNDPEGLAALGVSDLAELLPFSRSMKVPLAFDLFGEEAVLRTQRFLDSCEAACNSHEPWLQYRGPESSLTAKYDWDSGKLTLLRPDGIVEIETPATPAGFFDLRDASWQWAWAADHVPPATRTRADSIRLLGRRESIPLLEVPRSPVDRRLAKQYGAVACFALSGQGVYWVTDEHGVETCFVIAAD